MPKTHIYEAFGAPQTQVHAKPVCSRILSFGRGLPRTLSFGTPPAQKRMSPRKSAQIRTKSTQFARKSKSAKRSSNQPVAKVRQNSRRVQVGKTVRAKRTPGTPTGTSEANPSLRALATPRVGSQVPPGPLGSRARCARVNGVKQRRAR